MKTCCGHEGARLLYHNVTPAHYFKGDHPNLVRASDLGVRQLAEMKGAFDAVLTHSQFSAGQLDSLGFRDVKVLPYVILPSLSRYSRMLKSSGDTRPTGSSICLRLRRFVRIRGSRTAFWSSIISNAFYVPIAD